MKKKGVFIRLPTKMYDDLLNLSAAATLLNRKNVSVPGLILQILEETVQSNGVTRSKMSVRQR